MRKVVGVIMLLLAGLLSFGILGSFGSFIDRITNYDGPVGQKSGYIFGSILAEVLFVVIVYLLIKYGLRNLSRKKKTNVNDDINSIGKI